MRSGACARRFMLILGIACVALGSSAPLEGQERGPIELPDGMSEDLDLLATDLNGDGF